MRVRDLEEVRELVRAEVRLEDVVRHYGVETRGVGSTHFKALCPFHEETEPSFSVNVQKQLWYCHGRCKRGGDVFSFVQLKECVGHGDAIATLARYAGFDLGPYMRDPTPQEREEERLQRLNEAVWAALQDVADIRWPAERAFDPDTLALYGVRYSAALPDVKASRTVKGSLQLDWKAKWEHTVVIPLRGSTGRIAGFRCRTKGGKGRPLGPDEKHPLPVPPVYGLYEARAAIRDAGFAIAVEGESDVWQMRAHGWANVVGVMGSKLGDDELAYLADHGVRMVVLLPDGDKPGRDFALAVSSTHRKTPVQIKVASLADGDPDEVLLRDPDEVRDALQDAVYAFEYLIRRVLSGQVFDTLTDRVDALAELRPYFSTAPAYERDLAVRDLARRLQMDPESVEDFFREAPGDSAGHSSLVNIRGERIVLAGMLLDEFFAGEALLQVDSSAFHLAKHRRLFEVISRLFTTREAVNEDTVAVYLNNRGDEGLAAYVRSLLEADDSASRSFMLKDVKDKAIRRAVRRDAQDAALRLGDTSNDARALIQTLSGALAVAVVGQTKSLRTADELSRQHMVTVMERVRDPQLIVGLDLGPDWTTLNQALRGLQNQLIVIAAPTTVGKTAIAGCWFERIAVELKEPALYCTFETDDHTLWLRIIARMSGVESEKIVTGYMTAEELERVQDAAADFAASPAIITRAGQNWQEAQAVIRHNHMVHGIKAAFIDFIQLQRILGWKDRRDLELGEIANGYLALAYELGIPIVALAQTNRAGTKTAKAGANADMSDTGESIGIPQAADVYAVFRFKTKDEVEADGAPLGNRAGFLDKNRGGRRGIGFHVVADEATSWYREAKDGRAEVAKEPARERARATGGAQAPRALHDVRGKGSKGPDDLRDVRRGSRRLPAPYGKRP